MLKLLRERRRRSRNGRWSRGEDRHEATDGDVSHGPDHVHPSATQISELPVDAPSITDFNSE